MFCIGEVLIEGIQGEFYPTKEENLTKNLIAGHFHLELHWNI